MTTPGNWRKSSRSQGGGQCVETRTFNHGNASVEVRDSKAPQLGSLAIDRAEFTALLDSVEVTDSLRRTDLLRPRTSFVLSHM